MTPDVALEQEILIALLDGWVGRDEILEWVEVESAAQVDAVISGLAARGLAIRGEVSTDGFAPSDTGRWLRRTHEGEERAHALEATRDNRGFPPRKKKGRCG